MNQTDRSIHTSSQQDIDEHFMRRCLQLARNGRLTARPNPSVGAVIVSADGRILGEGFTSPYGGPHAEVNAFASVCPEDESLLTDATIYVSLEPCSHWGHTPPCCDLIVGKRVRRCVCGCVDPFTKVQGRGVQRMREAGIEVTVGVLEQECMESNRFFMTFNRFSRPYILLKWAQTSNGFLNTVSDTAQYVPICISTPYTFMLVHQLRAEYESILVGRNTLLTDNSRLDVRLWSGKNPYRLVLTHHAEEVPEGFKAFDNIDDMFAHLRELQCQSLMVEGGAATLEGFIKRGLWDEIHVETAPFMVNEGISAPCLPAEAQLVRQQTIDENVISWYQKR